MKELAKHHCTKHANSWIPKSMLGHLIAAAERGRVDYVHPAIRRGVTINYEKSVWTTFSVTASALAARTRL